LDKSVGTVAHLTPHIVFNQWRWANHQQSLKSSYAFHEKTLGSVSAKSSQDRRYAGRTKLTSGDTPQAASVQAAAYDAPAGHQPIVQRPAAAPHVAQRLLPAPVAAVLLTRSSTCYSGDGMTQTMSLLGDGTATTGSSQRRHGERRQRSNCSISHGTLTRVNL
jgi:hypothetical protein